MNYGFIGLGNMAGAIIRGMAGCGAFCEDNILGFDKVPDKAEILAAECGLVPCKSVTELAEKSDVIILAVKPQILPEVMPSVAEKAGGRLIITIAAGKSLEWYSGRLPESSPVIRVMPNINATVCASVSALCKNEFVTEKQLQLAKGVFNAVGSTYDVEERLFPAYSAICGASGAFVLLYIDSLAEAGVRAGFPRALAEEFAVSTVLGTAKYKSETGEHPIVLMNKICSPGGTTIEGVLKLKELGFENAVNKGIEAIIEKDKKI